METSNNVKQQIPREISKSTQGATQTSVATNSTTDIPGNQLSQSVSEWSQFIKFCQTQFYQKAFIQVEKELLQANLVCYMIYSSQLKFRFFKLSY